MADDDADANDAALNEEPLEAAVQPTFKQLSRGLYVQRTLMVNGLMCSARARVPSTSHKAIGRRLYQRDLQDDTMRYAPAQLLELSDAFFETLGVKRPRAPSPETAESPPAADDDEAQEEAEGGEMEEPPPGPGVGASPEPETPTGMPAATNSYKSPSFGGTPASTVFGGSQPPAAGGGGGGTSAADAMLGTEVPDGGTQADAAAGGDEDERPERWAFPRIGPDTEDPEDLEHVHPDRRLEHFDEAGVDAEEMEETVVLEAMAVEGDADGNQGAASLAEKTGSFGCSSCGVAATPEWAVMSTDSSPMLSVYRCVVGIIKEGGRRSDVETSTAI